MSKKYKKASKASSYFKPQVAEDSRGKNAVILTRVSSDRQVREWHWIESQETTVRDWSKTNSVNIVKVFKDEWISGKYDSREGIDSMIKFLDKENQKYINVDYVLVDDIDRVIRDVQWWWDINDKINDTWAKIHSLSQRLEDTPEGNFTTNLTMASKQYEREGGAKRTATRMRARLIAWYWTFYCPPWYEYVAIKAVDWRENKILILNPSLADIIRDWLNLFAEWTILNKTKLKDYFNERWVKWRIKWEKINQSYVDRILEKDRLLFYAWYIEYSEWNVGLKKAKHEAIIDMYTVSKITDRLNPKTNNLIHTRKDICETLILRWFLYCKDCDHKMTWSPSKNKMGNYYFYYTCRNKGCIQYWKSFNSTIVHSEFEDMLKKCSVTDKTIKLLEVIFNDLWKNKEWVQNQLLNDKKKRIGSIDIELNSLYKKLTSATNEKIIEIYENRIILLTEERKGLEWELLEDSKFNDENLTRLLDETKTVLANPKFIWEIWNIELKHLLIGVCFWWKLVYSKDSKLQTPEIPFIYKLSEELKDKKDNLVEAAGFEPASKSVN